jgi:hypothetical protein
LAPRSAYIRAYGALPFQQDEDLKVALQDRLAVTDALEKRIRLILGALVQGVDPRWVRSRLAAWEVHPVSIILAGVVSKHRTELAEALMPGQTEWTFGLSTVFTGLSLPRGLHLPGALVLDGCEDLSALPDDLSTPCLVIQNCRNLRSLLRIPPGVSGLQVEHAPNLIELPDSVKLKHEFRLSACPQVEQLPSHLHASAIKISHCPGLRSICSKINCHTLELSTLINLTTIDLDLTVSSGMDLSLPSLATWKGRAKVNGRLRIACSSLHKLEAEITVGDQMMVEHCRLLESIDGLIHVKRDLSIKRCPKFSATPAGFVGGNLELTDLPSLRHVDPSLIASCRRARIQRCETLECLPYGVHLRGSLDLIDLPALAYWPPSMNVGILTVLGCPLLLDPPPGVTVRSGIRRATSGERRAVSQALSEDSEGDQASIEPLRRLIRVLMSSGVSFASAMDMLHADGHAKGDTLVAAAAEGLGLHEFLDRCAGLSDGRGGEIEAARACVRASIHPASLALVVKDLTKARWLAELYSDSKDLAAGLTGDGNLRIQPKAAWDLPDDLAVPGQIRASGAEGEPRWPSRMRVLGGIKIQPAETESPGDALLMD